MRQTLILASLGVLLVILAGCHRGSHVYSRVSYASYGPAYYDDHCDPVVVHHVRHVHSTRHGRHHGGPPVHLPRRAPHCGY
ncbi:MAG: hypothetical protein HRU76_01980 [Phycisphaeraceae bacterium]|nr:hypothetical protein [Phycisphaerales bacterium]QOJ16432.1 MAG: hypothetical protein HRU76_01980 [Phycisphaeraceae bacterium]